MNRPSHHACLAGECELIALKLKEEEKANPNRRKVLERVVVSPKSAVQRHHWGAVYPRPGGRQNSVCLAKDRFRVRVEGWEGDLVVPQGEWRLADPEDCNGQIVIAVWTPHRMTQETSWGPIPTYSGHPHSYWIEYAGPLTGGVIRRAGPFGCTGDPVDHAMEDAGFTEPGKDGGYVIFDEYDDVVDQGL